MLLIKHSNTSNLIRFTLKNSSTGVGLTGLSSASTGLIISTIADNEATATAYTVAGATIETIVALGTYAAPTATKCRFAQVDAVNHKGLYEFQFADARFAVASARKLVISVTGATSLLDADYEILLVSFDPHDAVRAGLTALPNAIPDAVGGLPVTGTRLTAIPTLPAALAADGFIKASLFGAMGTALTETAGLIAAAISKFFNKATPTGTINSLPDAVPGANLGLPTTNGTTVSQTVTLTATSIQAIWDALTSALITAGSIGKKLADWVVGTIDTYTGNTKQTGDNYTRLGAPVGASVSADVAAAKADTAAILLDTGTDGVVLKAAGLNADAVDEILDEVVEGSVTLRHAIKIFLAALAGKSTGGGTATLIFRDNADVKARITATVDANGNRIAMTLDGT